jgi:hypothetical protein
MASKKSQTAKRDSKKIKKVKAVKLEHWLQKIQKGHEDAVAAGNEGGACLVSDPHTGQNQCILTDQATCKSLHGVFLGGPCGD